MANTPVYNLSYYALTDSPNYPVQGQDLAQDVEAALISIVASLTALAENKPRAYLRMTSATSCVNGAFTILPFNLENIDSHNGHSTVSLTTRYVVQVAGDYWCGGAVEFATNGTGGRGGTWFKNGVEYDNAQILVGNTGGIIPTTAPNGPVLIPCVPGDYLEMGAYQNSGGALNATGARAVILKGGLT